MYIVDANRPYNSGLQALQQAVDKAAEPAANKDDAANSLRDSGKSAELTARQMGSAFPPDTEAQLEQRSLDLLLQPTRYLDGMVASNLKGAGENFCQTFNQATRRKFPFDPQSKDDARLEDLAGLLQAKPGNCGSTTSPI